MIAALRCFKALGPEPGKSSCVPNSLVDLGKYLSSQSLSFPICNIRRFNFEVASCSRTSMILPLVAVALMLVLALC